MKWTEKEIEIIIQNAHLSNRKLSEMLNRTTASVSSYIRMHDLRKIKRGPYSPEDEQYLRDHYLRKTNRELASILRRTEDAIYHKLNKLELFRPAESPIIDESLSKADRAKIVNANYLKLFGWKAA